MIGRSFRTGAWRFTLVTRFSRSGWASGRFGLRGGYGPQGEQVTGSAGPVLGVADLLRGGQVRVVPVQDGLDHRFGGGLLVGRVAGWRGVPVTMCAVLESRPLVSPTYRDRRESVPVTSRWAVSTVRPCPTWVLPAWSSSALSARYALGTRNGLVQVPSSSRRRTSALGPFHPVILSVSQLDPASSRTFLPRRRSASYMPAAGPWQLPRWRRVSCRAGRSDPANLRSYCAPQTFNFCSYGSVRGSSLSERATQTAGQGGCSQEKAASGASWYDPPSRNFSQPYAIL